MQSHSQPVAWLSLSTQQNDLASYMIYLVAAIQSAAPAACPNTASLLAGGQAPVPVLHAALVNELAALPHPLVLVLDDYSSISSLTVHEFMSALIDNLPPTVHVVMTTRASPLLPLVRWRASQELAEIRVADLRCEEEETPALLTAMLGATTVPDIVDMIHSRTEGWVTGLRLTALSLQRTDPRRLVAALTRSGTVNLRDYLLDEVFNRQPPAVQDFLLKTSILERFCAPLCTAVMAGDADVSTTTGAAQSMIDYLTKAGLFIMALDEEDAWHRYHHLFAELLRHRLRSQQGEEMVAALHRTAGQWFAGQGLVDEAIHHLIAGDDTSGAAEMTAGHVRSALNREEWPQLERWLALLPEAAVNRHPGLVLAQAWCLQVRLAIVAIPNLLTRAETLLENSARADATALAGQIAVLRSQLALFRGDVAAMLAYAQAGLQQVPDEERYVRSLAVFFGAVGAQMAGQADETERRLIELLSATPGRIDAFSIRLQFALGTNYRAGGALANMQALAARMLPAAQTAHLPLGEGWARVFLGHFAYETNDLANAEVHFAAGARLMFVAHAAAVRDCLGGLLLLQMAQRRFDEASATLERLRTFRFGLDVEIDSLTARLALAQGNKAAAKRWAESYQPANLTPFLLWQEVPQISLARALIAIGTAETLRRALGIAQELTGWAESVHCLWRMIECRALQALALDGLGRPKEADQALHAALLLGQSAGYLRLFLDLGPQLRAMLPRQMRYGNVVLYARQLMHAMGGVTEPREQVAGKPATQGVESFTEREQEVLFLLARRLSTKEIAHELVISPNTVKRHTQQIFAKLDVNDRRTAVERARLYRLLPE
jgi:LuxR family maltose regulon positive regulatory protein